MTIKVGKHIFFDWKYEIVNVTRILYRSCHCCDLVIDITNSDVGTFNVEIDTSN